MTSKRTRAKSTESSVPVTTNSQTRSVSRPFHPALLLTPSGGVRLERARGLLTTAMWARVWEAISSSRRRTSGLSEGFEEGESRISERATLIAARCYGMSAGAERKGKETNLDGTLLENHPASGHDLLIGASDVEIPSPSMVCEEVGDVAAMQGHGHHCDFLDSIRVCREGDVCQGGGQMMVVVGWRGKGIGDGGQLVVEGGRWRTNVTRLAWIRKRC